MYKYKVEIYRKIDGYGGAEDEMNRLAIYGWRVVAISPTESAGLIVVYQSGNSIDS